MEKDKVLKSEIAFKGKIFDIKIDEVLLENGNKARRDILVHKGACCGVPIDKDNNVIMVKQYRHATGEFLLEIPAGGLEIGEDPKECIVRELQEEIGYKPGKVEPLFSMWLAPGYSSEHLHCFICSDLEESILPCDDDENLKVVKLSFNEIESKILSGEITDAKTIACCMTVKAKLNL